ncbi:MAG: AlpA family phage regulatory protein [Rubrivivax sp.]|nr:AlpA family phage regulatory protein [Rubrivivax sp.]
MSTPLQLPATGYIRQNILIGESSVSEEQAENNAAAGRSPRRPRPGRPPIVPFSSATLWRKVRAGEFPAPVKLSDRVTAWRCEDVAAWIKAQGNKPRR